jgi:hypothetical protein
MQVKKGAGQKGMKPLFKVDSSLATEVRISVAFLCLQGDVKLYAYLACGVKFSLRH